MHLLERPKKPKRLNTKLEVELTSKFKKSGASVWKRKFIKDLLYEMTGSNCAYCESNLLEAGNYMQIEHFKHKDAYPDDVVSWDNLLPSCKRCNSKKLTHDVVKEPIINPCETDPRDHLELQNYRFRGRDKLGESTEEVLDLNDPDRLMFTRFKLGERFYEKLSDLKTIVKQLEKSNSKGVDVKMLNKIISPLKKYMDLGAPKSSYCSIVSSIILANQDYYYVKKYLKSINKWDKEFKVKEGKLKSIAYKQ